MAAGICLILAALVGTMSTGEAMGLFELSRPAAPSPRTLLGTRPELIAEVQKAQLAALKAMQIPRVMTLMALATVCGFLMIGAYRMLKPSRLPLDAARRLTAQSAAVAAILRTIDGAQQAVVAKKAAPQMADLMVQLLHPPDTQTAVALRAAAPNFSVASMAALTILVAGSFCALWQYLRSKQVQDALARGS